MREAPQMLKRFGLHLFAMDRSQRGMKELKRICPEGFVSKISKFEDMTSENERTAIDDFFKRVNMKD